MTTAKVKVVPGSPEWLRTITASKIPAILGISRFQSQFTLWHTMNGSVAPEPIPEARQEDFDYGHACELAAREFWRHRNPGWRVSPGEVQYSKLELPFPHFATLDFRATKGRAQKVIEVKKARDKYAFGDDGSGDIPIDFAAQMTWQMMESGFTNHAAELVAWFEYGKPAIYQLPFDADIAAAILARVMAWAESLERGIPPALDDSVSTYETVRRQHPDIDTEKKIWVPVRFAEDYIMAHQGEKRAEDYHREMKTQLLAKAENAGTIMVGDMVLAKRIPGRGDSVTLRRDTKTTLAMIDTIDEGAQE